MLIADMWVKDSGSTNCWIGLIRSTAGLGFGLFLGLVLKFRFIT